MRINKSKHQVTNKRGRGRGIILRAFEQTNALTQSIFVFRFNLLKWQFTTDGTLTLKSASYSLLLALASQPSRFTPNTVAAHTETPNSSKNQVLYLAL